jgi:FtsH-binding integral membrane protein
MKEEELYQMINEKERGLNMSIAFPALMRKVFLWMTLALIITAVTAYGVATSPALITAIFTNKILFWGLIIAEFALVFGVTAAINRLSLASATLLFILYSIVNGAMLSVIFYAFSMTVIVKTFAVTAGTFGVMALIGYTTKKDLTSIGKLLFMALIGLMIATVVNIFVRSSGFDLIVSYIGVIIFVGLTAWDTQKIKLMLSQAPDTSESYQKMALMGALSLYLDFINLFLYLLRIFGNNRN